MAARYAVALPPALAALIDANDANDPIARQFVPDAADTRYDAFMKIGPTSYLVLNHTVKTMNEIRADGKWLGAQAVFEHIRPERGIFLPNPMDF